MKKVWYGLRSALLGVLIACDGDPQNINVTLHYPDAAVSQGGDTINCNPGAEGCECALGDFPCEEGLICDPSSNRCKAEQGQSCNPGELGCACYPNFTCDQGDDGRWMYCSAGFVCAETECLPGAEGCGCLFDGRCDAGLACVAEEGSAGLCQRTDCDPGQPGCGCTADRVCDEGADGTPHVCDGQRCVPVNELCPPGAESCPCFANLSCAQGLFCNLSTYRCGPPSVRPGSLGAACRDDSSCDLGLECDSDRTCQSPSCTRGEEGCGCFPNLSCATSSNGPALICTGDGTCRRTDCYAGDLGCGCTPEGTCLLGGVCEGSICVPFVPTDEANIAREPAISGVCFSPCRESITLGTGAFKRCDADGLIAFNEGESCLPRVTEGVDGITETPTVCRAGSCLTATEAPTPCGLSDEAHLDLACPDFQACIDGVCASNCISDADCQLGRVCDRHVCRASCTPTARTCASSEYCAVKDGVSGTCRPLSSPSGDEISSVDGSFALGTTGLNFSNIKIEQRFSVTNQSPQRLTFTVRKAADTSIDALPDDQTPLFWLRLGYGRVDTNGVFQQVVAPQQTQSLDIPIDSGATVEIVVSNAANENRPLWQGTLEVGTPTLGRRSIGLSYIQRPEGQWSGKVYYFGQFKIDPARLAAWMSAGRPTGAAASNLGNALLQRWVALRGGQISAAEFDAVLQSTLTRSWDFQGVRQACVEAGFSRSLCYPWVVDGELSGVAQYTSNPETEPVPSGLVELPIALNLKLSQGDPRLLQGRIETSTALQYAGDPAVTVRLLSDPAAQGSASCDPAMYGRSARDRVCAVRLQDFSSTVVVGGRFPSDTTDQDCPNSHATLGLTSYPWLLEGFEDVTGVGRDPQTGALRRLECRHKTVPGGVDLAQENLNFAGANPIPDGRARVRQLTLVDGLLIDQSRLLVLFKESYGSFIGEVGSEEFAAYGLMELRRTPAQLEPSEFVGSTQADPAPTSTSALHASCDADLLALNDEIPGVLPTGLTASTRLGLMIDGVASEPRIDDFVTPDPARSFYAGRDPAFSIHYVCHNTGRFDDCGARLGTRFSECPAGSGVSFLLFDRAQLGAEDLCRQPCNQDGSCLSLVEDEAGEATPSLEELGGSVKPAWRCEASDEAICSEDRFDLRAGKRFYRPDITTPPALTPFLSSAADAFRYKTRFRNREGTNIGFTPRLCIPGSEAMQYCYDPTEIEQLSRRVDCALATYADSDIRDLLTVEARGVARDFLAEAFGAKYTVDGELVRDGFESLYAELMVMLGDDAYTSSFASRFDLAGVRGGAFMGSMFEEGGFDLAGPAGFEMRSLYQATQAYQLTLDRFYRLSPTLWQSLSMNQGDSFLGKETVVNYLTRLVRASSQKARAWSAIAERYQSFNRPDLARKVVERAYTSAYIESMALGRFLRELRNSLATNQRDQVDSEAERAQRVYRSALLEMRDVYQDISDNVTLFGLPPEYIPLPALNPGMSNAFEQLLQGALEKTRIASDKEDRALDQNRAYETDRASFERELTQVKNTYEDRLAQICGTFSTNDARVFPAISRYADLTPQTQRFGDPCGLVGNGEIYNAIAQIELARLDLQKVIESRDQVLERVKLEKQRAASQCSLISERADIEFRLGNAETSLEREIRSSQTDAERSRRDLESLKQITTLSKCSIITGLAVGGDCLYSAVQSAVFSLGSGLLEMSIQNQEDRIEERRRKIERLRLSTNRDLTLLGCEQVNIDSWARVKEILLELEQNTLDLTQADYNIRLRLSEVIRLKNEATRLANEQIEANQLSINVEAARNDPNTRIYKNDAILNADRTFKSALLAAYKATRVFEYYTSQSYAHLNDLFLVRLISRGDISLENYLADLSDAFDEFEEQFGHPDVRVAVLSVKNDILSIPRMEKDGRPLSERERTERLRASLVDTSRLDSNGYLTLPFGTSLRLLSPLTRDHKVLYVEAEISGTGNGDQVGRLYLRQSGTGLVQSLEDQSLYYRFPERTAVLNPFFNGQRVFAPEVYRNERLRDRPFVNSHWELVLNQRDELANQDINLNAIDDIRLFVYYSDFTEL